MVTHYEDVREVYQNADLYSTEGAANFQGMVGETFRMLPLATNPPAHDKYRMFLRPWFSPRAVSELEPKMRAAISELIDTFESKGECDAAYDFGRVHLVLVIMEHFEPEAFLEAIERYRINPHPGGADHVRAASQSAETDPRKVRPVLA